jgi:hypothetical protein
MNAIILNAAQVLSFIGATFIITIWPLLSVVCQVCAARYVLCFCSHRVIILVFLSTTANASTAFEPSTPEHAAH